MYTFGTNYPDIQYYNDSIEFRNIKGDLFWDDSLCSNIQEELDGVTFRWDSSDKYLPIEFTYDFVKTLPIPLISNKEISIKEGITYVKFLVPISINLFLDQFNFN